MNLISLALWIVCLSSGGFIGILMVPVEAAVMGVAWVLGSRDVRWRELGFVFRQFTDIRALRSMYPLSRQK